MTNAAATDAPGNLTTELGSGLSQSDNFHPDTNPKAKDKYYILYKMILNRTNPESVEHLSSNPDIHDGSLGTTLDFVGLMLAMLVSLSIIILMAFIIRKIRQRQSQSEDEEKNVGDSTQNTNGEDSTKATEEISGEDAEASTKQAFTISFIEVPNNTMVQHLPKFLRPKPKPVDFDKLRRELGHIYVY